MNANTMPRRLDISNGLGQAIMVSCPTREVYTIMCNVEMFDHNEQQTQLPGYGH